MINKDIAQILDECLDKAILKSKPEITLEECLSEYRMVKLDLEPLLKTAQYTRDSLSTVVPSSEFNQRALANLLGRAEQLRVIPKSAPGLSFAVRVAAFTRLIFQRRAWATVAAGVLALILAGGTVGASRSALPEEILYPVKLGVEQVQLKLTSDPEKKARLYMDYAGRRVEEMTQIAGKENTEGIGKLEEKLALNLENARAIAEELKGQPAKAADAQKLQDELIERAEGNVTTLRRAIPQVPAVSGKRLEIVIGRTLTGYTTPQGLIERSSGKEQRPAALEDVPAGQQSPEKTPTAQETPEGKAVPAGPGSAGRQWEIRQK